MKSIRKKFTFFFITIMLVSSILSFCAYFFLNKSNVINEFEINQRTIAISILELDQKTDLSIYSISKINTNPLYNIRIIDNIDILNLEDNHLKDIENGSIVFINTTVNTIVKVRDHYINISLHSDNNIVKILISRIEITFILYLLIGSCLVAIFSKKAVKKILDLTEATKKVAKGNFDIYIEHRADDEIGQLATNFNRMAKELKSIEYLRKDFMDNVSHELRTPIASILGFAKLLKSDSLSVDERTEYIDIIIQEASRLSNLSSNILRLSKLETQELFGEKTSFRMDEQIRRSIVLLETDWGAKNIVFDLDLRTVEFCGYEDLLQQVWINILHNAIKFSSNEGVIYVKLYTIESSVKIKIKDEGIGMSEDVKSRIFEKFYQGDTVDDLNGNGLGLSLVNKIVDICKGNIEVRSKPGNGTTFLIELPVELD